MSQKSCFFIGHRETPEEIYPVLCAAVEEHIVRYGVTEFIVGRYGCFDGLAAKAVKTAKQTHPEVELTLLLPYHPAERPIPVPDGFDSTLLRDTFRELRECGYVHIQWADNIPYYLSLTVDGQNYFTNKKDAKKAERKLSRREWRIAVISAIIGGMVGLIPWICTLIGGGQ